MEANVERRRQARRTLVVVSGQRARSGRPHEESASGGQGDARRRSSLAVCGGETTKGETQGISDPHPREPNTPHRLNLYYLVVAQHLIGFPYSLEAFYTFYRAVL